MGIWRRWLIEYEFISKTENLDCYRHFVAFYCNTIRPHSPWRNCIAHQLTVIRSMVSFSYEVVAMPILFGLFRALSISYNSYYYLTKTSQSFRSDLCETALSSLLGVSPAASSALFHANHPRKSLWAFNQIIVWNILHGWANGIARTAYGFAQHFRFCRVVPHGRTRSSPAEAGTLFVFLLKSWKTVKMLAADRRNGNYLCCIDVDFTTSLW